jgi:hypothetical protein
MIMVSCLISALRELYEGYGVIYELLARGIVTVLSIKEHDFEFWPFIPNFIEEFISNFYKLEYGDHYKFKHESQIYMLNVIKLFKK